MSLLSKIQCAAVMEMCGVEESPDTKNLMGLFDKSFSKFRLDVIEFNEWFFDDSEFDN